jgi:hypothetical protein
MSCWSRQHLQLLAPAPFSRRVDVRPNYLAMRNAADVTGGNPIAVPSQSISVGNAVNPLVAFYDIHERKREVLFFCSVPDTTRDISYLVEFRLQ